MQACEISFISPSIVVKFSVSFLFFLSIIPLSLSLPLDVIYERLRRPTKNAVTLSLDQSLYLLDTSLMARQFDIKKEKYNSK
jgi:hypothetical protein